MAWGFVDLAALAFNAGFAAGDAQTAAAIALAESAGNPNALGDGGTSYGLWQIHAPAHPEADAAQLYNPVYNARIAFGTWKAAKGFTPWTTFRNGAYKRFLSAPEPSPHPTDTGSSKMGVFLLLTLGGIFAAKRWRK